MLLQVIIPISFPWDIYKLFLVYFIFMFSKRARSTCVHSHTSIRIILNESWNMNSPLKKMEFTLTDKSIAKDVLCKANSYKNWSVIKKNPKEHIVTLPKVISPKLHTLLVIFYRIIDWEVTLGALYVVM